MSLKIQEEETASVRLFVFYFSVITKADEAVAI